MAETTLALKLSGEEIRKALVDTLDQELKKNCFLNPNGAYDSFAGKIVVDIMLHDTGQNMHLEANKEISQGEVPEGTKGESIEIPVDTAPPNSVRIETGQPVPALTRDGEGHATVKGIRYARRGKKGV